MKLSKKLIAGLLASVAIFTAGCGGGDKAANDKAAVSFVLNSEPASLDPAVTYGLGESTVELAMYEGLTRMDDKNQPQPALAESWEVSADGTVYTFKLREGITWSDGTAITANDFVYSWLRALSPELATSNAYMLFNIKNGEEYNSGKVQADAVGVKAIDDRTLQVELTGPAPYFLGLTAFHCFYPVPKALAEKDQTAWASNGEGLLSSGPFKVVSWNHSNEIVLEKNDKYWNAADVKPQTVKMPISESNTTALTLVENGTADMMLQPPSADEKRLRDSGLYQVYPQLGTSYYVFNVKKAPFDKLEVRKALALAIQRQQLIDNVVKNGAKPAYAFVAPEIMANDKDFREEGGNLAVEDIEAAKAALKASGYNNEPITLLTNNSDTNKMLAEAVQAMWKANLGINIELTSQENKVFYDSREHGEYQIACANWIADFADPINFLQVFSDAVNDAQYHNPVYDGLIKQIMQENNPAVRNQLMHQAEKILFDDCVLIPIYYTSNPAAVNSKLKGLITSPMGTIDFIHVYKD